MNFVLPTQGSEDLRVRVWDTRSGALRAVQTLEGYVYFPVSWVHAAMLFPRVLCPATP